MKIITTLLTLAAIASLTVPLVSEEAPGNLLKNPGFEKIEADGKPTGWITGSPEPDKAEFHVVTDNPKEGKGLLKIKGQVTWAAAFQKVPADKAKTYTLTGYTRSTKGYTMIKLDYWQEDNHLGQTLTEVLDAPGGEWRQVTVTSELDQYPQATHLSATVAIGGDAEADFDALTLTAK